MLINRFFMPDLYLDDIYCIEIEYLKKNKITSVLLDIDNTLVTYDDPEPTEGVLKWFSLLKENGISIAFISNNDKARVEKFNEKLGFYAFWKAGKPSVKCYNKAMELLKIGKENACVIGDQVFTDVWSAKRAGLHSILVKPIKDKPTFFFKFKRWLEKPILSKYKRKQRK